MTINYDNVYLKEVATTAGLKEKEGSFKNLYDKTYNDYYAGEKTFEQAEIKMIKDCYNILLSKSKKDIKNIDAIISGDLLNQITPSAYSCLYFNRPFLGIYNACATLCEGIIIAGSLLQNNNINNIIVNTSSHNNTAERQFRNPVEYGFPKPKRSTFTVTGSAACLLVKEKTNITVSNVSIGTVTDLNVTDVYDMGSVMAPSAARTIYENMKDTNSKISDYDLILTGDLGVYGKKILIEYMKENYNINIENKLEDAASIIYDREKQKEVNAGGSGNSRLFTSV